MGWGNHLKDAGFKVTTTDMPDATPKKIEEGVPPRLGSCHTAIVDGYVVEGHVPAEDIKKLLTERPDVKGIAVPGMPIGSPGMEGISGGRQYSSYSFTEDGELAVFGTHQPRSRQ